VAGSCGHGNEPFSSIKGVEFLDYLTLLLAYEGLCYVDLSRSTFQTFVMPPIIHRPDDGGSTHL
jgi:hypothetical protein